MTPVFWMGVGMTVAGMSVWGWALARGFSVRDEAARKAFDVDTHR